MRTILITACLLTSAATALAFEGSYTYRSASAQSTLIIKKQKADRYSVSNHVSWRNGCGGTFDSIGRVVGGKLVASKVEMGERCTLTITRSGNSMHVDEDGCLLQHGASCQFSGTYTRSR